jgi:hypothetical protein
MDRRTAPFNTPLLPLENEGDAAADAATGVPTFKSRSCTGFTLKPQRVTRLQPKPLQDIFHNPML